MSENVRFVTMGIGEGAVPYPEAWEEQQRLHALRVADEIPDTVLLLTLPTVATVVLLTRPTVNAWYAHRASLRSGRGA